MHVRLILVRQSHANFVSHFFLLFSFYSFELHNGRERTHYMEHFQCLAFCIAAVMPFHFDIFGVDSDVRWKLYDVELSNVTKQKHRTKHTEQE